MNHALKPNLAEYEHLFQSLVEGEPIWRIGIYVRLSKEDGNKVSCSVVNQIKKAARFLRDFENFVIYDIYIDDGLTGTDFDRADYIRLQDDINSKIINCFMVKDLTRYARNVADGVKELDKLVLEKNIRFVTCAKPYIDTFKDPRAISSTEVYQSLQEAESFARVTSDKVRDIKEIKREDGEINGGHPPYGYLPNPDGEHWIYDPVAGEIKKQMYMWSLEGMSDREIAKKLNDLGVPNPTAYKKSIGINYHSPYSESNSGLWWPTTVGRILADKNNIGCSVQGKSSAFDHKRHKQIPIPKEKHVVVEDCHEKTVSDELFEKVELLRAKRTRAIKGTGKVHMFANLVYCSNCNIAMKKTSAKGHSYLVCRTYKDIGKEYCSTKRTISFKTLETVVLNAIQSQINIVEGLQEIVEEINQQPLVSNQSIRINQLLENNQFEMKKAERLIDSSYYDWKNDDISKEQYQRIRTETESKLEQLRNTLRNLLGEQQKIANGIETNNQYFEIFSKYKNVEALDRLMLLELIHKIKVTEDKTIKIEFNYDNQYLLILDYIEQNKKSVMTRKREK